MNVVYDDLAVDIKLRLIAVSSPSARALIGKSAGESGEFVAPSGTWHDEIIDLRHT